MLRMSLLAKRRSVRVMVHVPAVRKDTTLTLYRLLPLPIQELPQALIIPNPNKIYIAVSKDEKWHHILSVEDLQTCEKCNKVYVCPKVNQLDQTGPHLAWAHCMTGN